METQRGEVTCLRSHSRILELELQSMAEPWDDFSERKLGIEKRGWRAGVGLRDMGGWSIPGQSTEILIVLDRKKGWGENVPR